MIICENLGIRDKLEILSAAAKYDVACTSSGVDRSNNAKGLGNTAPSGICHAFSADGRCISLLKILFTNECIYNCKYCANRASNDIVRTSFTPEEVCRLTMEFYRRNYIEGLFLSSGIIKNPTYTMGLLYETVRMLREQYHFGGYIHIKAIPGADESLIEMAGWYADRMSVNMELPTTDGLKMLAPNKSRSTILAPMRQIYTGIKKDSMRLGDERANRKLIDGFNTLASYNGGGLMRRQQPAQTFVPAGQSTQMIIGATKESDYQVMTIAEALYNRYSLKRVFYSAFINVNHDNDLPYADGGTPKAREHRLYQADWLLRFYGFTTAELLSKDKPDFNMMIDPKCDWAVRHLELFPVEINGADYNTLLRVPGIGPKSAGRIIKARRSARLDFKDIGKMGVVMKRAHYFITCSGRMLYNTRMDEDYIVRNLVDNDNRIRDFMGENVTYRQLSLFDGDVFKGIAQ